MRQQIVEATAAHALAILPRLRPADIEEAKRSGRTPAYALAYTLSRSPYSRAWLIDGEVACLVGVGITEAGIAMPWLWSSGMVDKYPVAFVRFWRRIAAEVMAQFPQVETIIEERYAAYIRWLEKSGVSISAPFHVPKVPGTFRRASLGA